MNKKFASCHQITMMMIMMKPLMTFLVKLFELMNQFLFIYYTLFKIVILYIPMCIIKATDLKPQASIMKILHSPSLQPFVTSLSYKHNTN